MFSTSSPWEQERVKVAADRRKLANMLLWPRRGAQGRHSLGGFARHLTHATCQGACEKFNNGVLHQAKTAATISLHHRDVTEDGVVRKRVEHPRVLRSQTEHGFYFHCEYKFSAIG